MLMEVLIQHQKMGFAFRNMTAESPFQIEELQQHTAVPARS